MVATHILPQVGHRNQNPSANSPSRQFSIRYQVPVHSTLVREPKRTVQSEAKLTPAQRTLFQLQNPRNQLITKVDLAKFENAWRFLPNIVSQGAQKNFVAFSTHAQTEWEKAPEQFNEEYYKRVVVKAMLFWKTEELVSKQPWYQGGYRANIVAYTIAKFAHLIQFESTGQLFDFKACWTRQGLTPSIENQLVQIAAEVFEVIVSPEGGFQNVTEWAKKEICWQQVQKLRIPLDQELAKQLVAREDEVIVDRLNASVKPNDTLYFLGDFCLGKHDDVAAYRNRLACKTIHFIDGNHDKTTQKLQHLFSSWNSLSGIHIGKQGNQRPIWSNVSYIFVLRKK